MTTTIEAPFAFFEEQKEAVLWDTIEPPQVAFGLVP